MSTGQFCWAVLGTGVTTASTEETSGSEFHGPYILRYCVTLISAHLSERVSALGGDDSRTFEHKGTLQGIGSAKSSKSLERKRMVELSELASRPTSQNWPREEIASSVTV